MTKILREAIASIKYNRKLRENNIMKELMEIKIRNAEIYISTKR